MMDIFCNSTNEVSFLIGKTGFKNFFLSCVDNGNGDHVAGMLVLQTAVFQGGVLPLKKDQESKT